MFFLKKRDAQIYARHNNIIVMPGHKVIKTVKRIRNNDNTRGNVEGYTVILNNLKTAVVTSNLNLLS